VYTDECTPFGWQWRRARGPSRLKETVMFLAPLLFHSYLGPTVTIVLVIALVALQFALRRALRHRRAQRGPRTSGAPRHHM
jgi:hypothetical protein